MRPGKGGGGRGWPVAWNSAAWTNPSGVTAISALCHHRSFVCRRRLFISSFGPNCNLFSCPSSSPLPPLPSLSLQHRCRFAHRKNPSFQEEESKIPRNLTFFPWIWNETVWERIKRTGFERLGKRGNRNEDKLETAIWPVICPGIISTNRDN